MTSSIRYKIGWSSLSDNTYYFLFTTCLFIFGDYVILLIILVINVLLTLELRKAMKRKKILVKGKVSAMTQHTLVKTMENNTLEADEKPKKNKKARKESNLSNAEIKIVIMVLWTSIIFFLSHLLHSFVSVDSFMSDPILIKFFDFANVLWGGTTIVLYIFVFYNTNNLFKKKLKTILKLNFIK